MTQSQVLPWHLPGLPPPCWARPLTYLQGSLFPCVPEPSFRISSWLHSQKITAQHGPLPCFLMCPQHYPYPGSGCVPRSVPRGLPSVPRALTPIFLLCLLGVYLAYLVARMTSCTSVTSPQSLLRITELSSVSPSSQGHSLPCLCHIVPSRGSQGQ